MSEDLTVIPSEGEYMVYSVLSSNGKKRYRCDLLYGEGAGRCECVDWDTRRGPNIAAGEPLGTRRTLCRHLILARRFFLQGLLQRLAQQEQTPPARQSRADRPF